MNSQQLYYIIIPMRFLNFLFILYWLLKDKNNFNIHIYIYTIYRYTIYTLMHIHTYNYKYHKYNTGDRKHFLWHTPYFLYKYFPLQQIYIYITKEVPTDLRKPTVCTVTRWFLAPYSCIQLANCHADSSICWHFLRVQWANCEKMATIDAEGEWPQISVLLSMKDGKGVWKEAQWQRTPGIRQGLVYVGWYSPLDGVMIADDKWVARLLLIHQQPGLCLQNWLVCFCLSDPDALKQEQIYLIPRDALSFLSLCLNDATILRWL